MNARKAAYSGDTHVVVENTCKVDTVDVLGPDAADVAQVAFECEHEKENLLLGYIVGREIWPSDGDFHLDIRPP